MKNGIYQFAIVRLFHQKSKKKLSLALLVICTMLIYMILQVISVVGIPIIMIFLENGMKKAIGLLVILGLAATPVLAQKINIDFAHHYNFKTIETFQYVETEETKAYNPLIADRVVSKIKQELTEGGLTEVDGDERDAGNRGDRRAARSPRAPMAKAGAHRCRKAEDREAQGIRPHQAGQIGGLLEHLGRVVTRFEDAGREPLDRSRYEQQYEHDDAEGSGNPHRRD